MSTTYRNEDVDPNEDELDHPSRTAQAVHHIVFCSLLEVDSRWLIDECTTTDSAPTALLLDPVIDITL